MYIKWTNLIHLDSLIFIDFFSYFQINHMYPKVFLVTISKLLIIGSLSESLHFHLLFFFIN